MRVKYVTTEEIASNWGLTESYVRSLCSDGRIKGAERFGCIWSIPENATWDVPRKTKDDGRLRGSGRCNRFRQVEPLR